MDYSKEVDNVTDTVDEIIRAIREGLSRMATEPRQGPSAAPGRSSGAATKVKPNRALEPEKLSRDFNTVEMKSWCRKFKAWYTQQQHEFGTNPRTTRISQNGD